MNFCKLTCNQAIFEIQTVIERGIPVENRLVAPDQSRVLAITAGAMVVTVAVLTLIGGLPPSDRVPSFIIGLGILIAVTTGIGLLGWHLIVRPLPANQQVAMKPLLTTPIRQMIAFILSLGTLSMGIAGVWDEIWHSKYGIPFGEDFFWRPHLMLYFGLTSLIMMGAWSWWIVQSRGKGTLQQRFHANPLLGICFVGGMYTIYAIVADPIWHKLFGSDIMPWSIPHLLILGLIMVMGLLAITFHRSLMPPATWRIAPAFHWRDILIVMVLVGALVAYLLIFTIQWYAAAEGNRQMGQVMNYPDWLFPMFLTFLATIFGTLALHNTRQVGTATLVGLLTIGVRFTLDTSLGGVRSGIAPLLIIVPLMVAMDVWYAFNIQRNGKPPVFWTTAGVVAAVFGVVGIPLMMSRFSYLPIVPMDIPFMIIASAITAAAVIKLGQMLSGIIGETDKTEETDVTAPSAAKSILSGQWANALLYVMFAVFVVFFVATAAPPV
jgi:hypothetical protein